MYSASSFRTKLQFSFVVLALAAITITGWQASVMASSALRQAGYDRLTAVRQTRASELERYFENIRSQVAALAVDATTLAAAQEFRRRDGRAHDRFHPTFHRYKTAFGYYDILLIAAGKGPDASRVLYTVMKEPDLGVQLDSDSYRDSPLAAVYRKALAQAPNGNAVIVDYQYYLASGAAPAAFAAAPLHVAGELIGVIAIQIAIDEVNAVMSGGGKWHEQGFGDTGEVYAVGPDNTLRSDLRQLIEKPETYLVGLPGDLAQRIRRNRTGVLAHTINLEVVERIHGGESGTELGRDSTGASVLRSHGPLHIGDLRWAIIAEVRTSEALAPIAALQWRIFTVGVAVAIVFFLAAGWLANSVTGPTLALASIARRFGKGERQLRSPVTGRDEIAQLATDFNRMAQDLEETTVSKKELEVLAGRLLTAQEDERRRVARELHDDFTQRLAAAAIEAGRLANASATDNAPLRRLKQELAAVSEDVHSLSRRLHPAMLDDLGLVASIEVECRAAFDRGLLVHLQTDGDIDHTPPETRLAVYRIVQEALRNIQKHAGVTEAELRLVRTPDALALRIRDEGEGFNRAHPNWRAGLGLASMEERARLLGGSFQVDSTVGQGTTILVRLPVKS